MKIRLTQCLAKTHSVRPLGLIGAVKTVPISILLHSHWMKRLVWQKRAFAVINPQKMIVVTLNSLEHFNFFQPICFGFMINNLSVLIRCHHSQRIAGNFSEVVYKI